ncbi:hypothetical protein BDQ17DRAFT_1370781, partial [Cyathus striatus]
FIPSPPSFPPYFLHHIARPFSLHYSLISSLHLLLPSSSVFPSTYHLPPSFLPLHLSSLIIPYIIYLLTPSLRSLSPSSLLFFPLFSPFSFLLFLIHSP